MDAQQMSQSRQFRAGFDTMQQVYDDTRVKRSRNPFASLLARGFLNLGPAILKHGAIRGIIGGDRKSTRLNSSHMA